MNEKVKFCAFAAAEFEDEELFYWTEALAQVEGKQRWVVEVELNDKLEYRRNDANRQHPFEVWGPQELSDRINAALKVAKFD